MSRINELRRGKRSTKPDSEETPLIAVVVIADIQDDPDGVNPIHCLLYTSDAADE